MKLYFPPPPPPTPANSSSPPVQRSGLASANPRFHHGCCRRVSGQVFALWSVFGFSLMIHPFPFRHLSISLQTRFLVCKTTQKPEEALHHTQDQDGPLPEVNNSFLQCLEFLTSQKLLTTDLVRDNRPTGPILDILFS